MDALNERLWEIINPKAEGKAEIKAGRRSYRVGDRIIHNKIRMTSATGTLAM